MQTAYIGIGSNLEQPVAQVRSALKALARLPESTLERHSALYRSAPWGNPRQPEFVNAVACLQTCLAPQRLLDALLRIERAAGRTRGAERWAARVLDLDILVFGNACIEEPGLRVPHPHLHERAFVLRPLAEIAPQLFIPGLGSVAALLAGVARDDCAPIALALSATR